MSSDSRVRNRISPIQHEQRQRGQRPRRRRAPDRDRHRVAGRPRREELHADPRDAGEREPDPHAAAEQREQRDDQQRGDQRHRSFALCSASAGSRGAGARPSTRARARRRTRSSSTSVPDGHRELRDPQRRRVVAGRDVVELPRLARRAARCRTRTARRAASPTPSAQSSSAALRARRRGARGAASRGCARRASACARARGSRPPPCSSRRRSRCRARGSRSSRPAMPVSTIASVPTKNNAARTPAAS